MHGEIEMRKILEYKHGTPCYMKENNNKIGRKNYCFKLGPDLSSFGQCFCVRGNESSVKKKRLKLSHQLFEYHFRKGCARLSLQMG
jgi:hypothetical protein